MKRSLHALCPVAMVACVLAAGGEMGAVQAQSGDVRAWVGILAEAGEGVEGGFAIRVRDVYRTGPAYRSGVVPGDLLVAVNGRPLADFEQWLRVLAGLEAGDSLALTVVRAGATRDTWIVADLRPGLRAAIDPAELASIQSRVWQRFDSIYERMGEGRANDSVFLTALNPRLRLRAAETRVQIGWERRTGDSGGLSATLSVVMQTETDSVAGRARMELSMLRQENRGVRGDIQGAAAAPDDDADNRSLSEPFNLIRGTPVLLGGVVVRDLTDALGRYFGVATGALVTDVPPTTPAWRTGFHPGDVIAGVAGQPVESVRDLRIALAAATLPIRITVVRRNETIELIYPPAQER